MVVPYRLDDADVVIVSMGTTAATARAAVDAVRARGIKAGSLRIRMFRPFPVEAVNAALAGARKIAVVDRDLSPGLGGVLWSELKTFYTGDALVQGTMLGLGGGDVRPDHLVAVIDALVARDRESAPEILEVA